jgi:predicted phosphodiesterase
MTLRKITDDIFIETWKRLKSPRAVANALGIPEREAYKRRRAVETKYGLTLAANADGVFVPDNRRRLEMGLEKGTVVVFSDAHYWPEDPSVAHEALIEVITELKPKLVVANGDVLDGARISRHEPLGWQDLPSVREELDVCTERLAEVKKAARGAKRIWTIGNHDIRFDRMLATNVSAFEGVKGTRLSDHFTDWQFGMSLHLNGSNTVVKHRWHNGVHAAYNNALKSGTNIVTGHLHRLAITPWGDYNGRRYGVDTGTLADPHGDQFSYGEDAPSPHAAGFAVLTFENGRLLPPELCEVVDGVAYFRGQRV